jgi:hypothetical protein
MSLDGVRWTWACQEPGCPTRIQTRAKEGPPACPRHGIDQVGRVCEICGVEIAGRRADAETCGAPCRAEKSRRDRSSNGRSEAHRGAQAKPAAPRRRSPERGVRIYFLPDELEAMLRGGASRRAPKRRAIEKLGVAAERLERRSS